MSGDTTRLAAAIGAIGAVTFAYARWLNVTNATTVALTFLLVVLVVAATSRLWVAIASSMAAMLSFNFFFLPPVGTLTIADPQNWVALVAFLAVSLVASNLSSVARAREHEAVARRDELSRLFDLSRDILVMTDSAEGLSVLARIVARRFEHPGEAGRCRPPVPRRRRRSPRRPTRRRAASEWRRDQGRTVELRCARARTVLRRCRS